MELGFRLENWASAASATIRFGPQREAVRRELLSHMQESLDAKLEAGMSIDKAEAMVLAEMGDPAPVAQHMAIIYRPFWGKLWQRTRLIKNIALVYLAAVLISNVYSGVSDRLSYDPDAYPSIFSEAGAVADIRPAGSIKVGDYTVSVHRLALCDSLEADSSAEFDGRTAYFTLKISNFNPRLNTPYFAYNMHTTDDLGNIYGIRNYSAELPGRETCGNLAFIGLFEAYMEMWVTDIPPEATRLTLGFGELGLDAALDISIPARAEYSPPGGKRGGE